MPEPVTCSFSGPMPIDDREAICPECRRVWRVANSYPFDSLTITQHTRPEDRPPAQRCTIPPPGWSCTRDPGHEGPCAAVPVIPTAADNPDGLHQRYRVEKLDGTTSPGALYFVLRLDAGGDNPLWTHACRMGALVVANLIAGHLPKVADDLRGLAMREEGIAAREDQPSVDPALAFLLDESFGDPPSRMLSGAGVPTFTYEPALVESLRDGYLERHPEMVEEVAAPVGGFTPREELGKVPDLCRLRDGALYPLGAGLVFPDHPVIPRRGAQFDGTRILGYPVRIVDDLGTTPPTSDDPMAAFNEWWETTGKHDGAVRAAAWGEDCSVWGACQTAFKAGEEAGRKNPPRAGLADVLGSLAGSVEEAAKAPDLRATCTVGGQRFRLILVPIADEQPLADPEGGA